MKKLNAALLSVFLSLPGLALAQPVKANGVNCWLEMYYYEKNWGGCFPQFKNRSGLTVHVCCG